MWLLIGYGNSLRNDDGFGLVVVEKWKQSMKDDDATYAEIETLSASQLKPEWAEQISQASAVIFVDASANLPPGELRCTSSFATGSLSNALHSFTHYYTPEILLHLARILYGAAPAAWIIEAGAEDLNMGESLSPGVNKLVPPAIKLIKELVSAQKEINSKYC